MRSSVLQPDVRQTVRIDAVAATDTQSIAEMVHNLKQTGVRSPMYHLMNVTAQEIASAGHVEGEEAAKQQRSPRECRTA